MLTAALWVLASLAPVALTMWAIWRGLATDHNPTWLTPPQARPTRPARRTPRRQQHLAALDIPPDWDVDTAKPYDPAELYEPPTIPDLTIPMEIAAA